MKNLKKISALFSLTLVGLAIILTSCDGDDDDNKNALKFNPAKAEVEVGKTALITVSGGVETYTVVSSDVKIATVKVEKSSITVTGVSKGTATIAVTDKNKLTGTIAVTVKEATIDLGFDKKTPEVGVGKDDVVTITGGTAPYAAVVKDATIATATVKDAKVTIKGVKVGTTTITVTDKDKKYSGVITVTVK